MQPNMFSSPSRQAATDTNTLLAVNASFSEEAVTAPPEQRSTSPSLTSPPSDPKPSRQVSLVIEEINLREKGRDSSNEPWLAFKLSVSEYKDLQVLIEHGGYVNQKLRYDFFPSAERFVLRMHTATHECFTGLVTAEITKQLSLIASRQGPGAEFAKEVLNMHLTTQTFDLSKYSTHDPDSSFAHSEAQYPGVVIETAFSQKTKDLPRLADEYILGSFGDICVVVGLDIEYSGKTATLSIWRPQFLKNDAGKKRLQVEQTVINQIFRDENGNPNTDPRAGLHLRLGDFACEPVVEQYGNLEDAVFIPAKDLSTYLDKAERRTSMVKQGRGRRTPIDPDLELCERESTPPEQLSPRREREFEDGENMANERSELDDPSYKG